MNNNINDINIIIDQWENYSIFDHKLGNNNNNNNNNIYFFNSGSFSGKE